LAEEKEEQRRSFAFGNTNIENPLIARVMVDRAADALGPPKVYPQGLKPAIKKRVGYRSAEALLHPKQVTGG
jgi:hypothetical protein